MKKLALALLLAAPMTASAAAKYVTVEVCDGDTGRVCRMVTYKERAPSAPEIVKCTIPNGDTQEIPCPTVYGVPGWLKSLNAAFGNGHYVEDTEMKPY